MVALRPPELCFRYVMKISRSSQICNIIHNNIISHCCQSQVSLMVTEVWLIVNFKGWFDIVFQGHHKYGKWCPVTWSHTVINHKSVSWMVTVMWPIEDSEGWAKPWPNLSRPFEIEQIMHNDIIAINQKSVSLTVIEIWPILKVITNMKNNAQLCHLSLLSIKRLHLSCWDMVNWNFSRPIWPRPNFTRSFEI